MYNRRRKKNKLFNIKKLKFYYKQIKNKTIFKIGKILLFFCFILILISILLKKTIFQETNYIKTITFNKENFINYYDENLYKNIISILSGKNIYLTISKKYFIKKNIKNQYPIIKDLTFAWDKKNQKLIIDLKFKIPNLIFQIGSGTFIGSFNGNLFKLNTKSKLITGIIIFLPDYITPTQSLSGFYFQISEYDLKNKIKIIQNYFGKQNIKKIIYYIGGGKLEINLSNNKKIFFDLTKNIQKQLIKLEYIKNNNISGNIIDVGSLENGFYIK